MKTLFAAILLFLCPLCLWTQQTYVKVSAEYTAQNEMVFWAENYSHIPHTVTLKFEDVSNTTTVMGGDQRSFVVGTTGKRRLMGLRPIDTKRPPTARYRAYYELGNTMARPDTAFVYLLPLRPGRMTQCNIISTIEKLPGSDESRQSGVVFRFREGDTVVAARAGIVTDLNDRGVVGRAAGRMFRTNENYVQVYHADGSFALYKLFADGGVFVNPGDEVQAGDALGRVGTDSSPGGPKLQFMVYTWEEVPAENPEVIRKRGRPWMPQFWLGESGVGKPQKSVKYTVQHPEEYVTREMSKKERKKYLSGK